MSGEVLVEARGVVKSFPGVWEHLILDHINFDVRAGEVHALLGENGAGKTVLANILSGFYTLTSGQIYVRGKPVHFKSPFDAIKNGIGMVHQEFTLVPSLTVVENIALMLRKHNPLSYPLKEVRERTLELSERYGLKIEPDRLVEHLSLGEKQRVEILKVLYWEPDVLILDEPTSVLTIDEARELFKILRRMAEEGKGVVFITHRIEEIMAVADRVTVLRLGRKMGTFKVSEVGKDELLRLMIGEMEPVRYERGRSVEWGRVVLEVRDLHVLSDDGREAVKGVSFEIHEGEILGIAGVSGNGQRELAEAITGLRKASRGRIRLMGLDITNKPAGEIAKLGVRHIPEERRRMGVVEPMCLAENMIIREYKEKTFSTAGVIKSKVITEHSKRLVERFKILTPDIWDTEVRILSGGNIQRLILARELWKGPKLLVAFHPTYGLDLKAVTHTHQHFMELRQKGAAILLISEDLEEIFLLSDRIAVMLDGRIVGTLGAREATPEKIGHMMAGVGAS
ncbi:MAG TPA: ABC transporter ATP-binding protein [Candidatus Caldiarchaeum subterraneum]|uniref:ABC transporter ATP-binding protein n=1 Tax=Caldiarchaeum subterraneum TaxID=311458 RepID=A0A832ZV07_CALS0|nr:ABC transporter ATP-binding protein [Aigarchaeota archaeon]HIQ29440.1 ABC transporter ATP-binding protein [Candidatus Caldarchaeum subterraneum]